MALSAYCDHVAVDPKFMASAWAPEARADAIADGRLFLTLTQN
jgi:hypothetical protein